MPTDAAEFLRSTAQDLAVISVIDYGMGNCGSVRNMLRKVGMESRLVSDPESVRNARKIILPGVGAFDEGMARLNASGLADAIRDVVRTRHAYVLGICLGMQLLARASEEGTAAGLNLIPGTVVRFRPEGENSNLKVPHMGWNHLTVVNSHPLLDGIEPGSRYYFVHSYHFVCDMGSDVLARTDYGISFNSVVGREGIVGVQFHPEKSLRWGMALLMRFGKVG